MQIDSVSTLLTEEGVNVSDLTGDVGINCVLATGPCIPPSFPGCCDVLITVVRLFQHQFEVLRSFLLIIYFVVGWAWIRCWPQLHYTPCLIAQPLMSRTFATVSVREP